MLRRLRLASRVSCVSLLMVAQLLSTVATAAPASGPDDAVETPPASGSSAEVIFRRGQAKYETADYNGAIELWTEAYALVDSTPENAAIKALLIYNLAQAHIKAFEIDDDAVHLKQAKQLLDSFAANLPMLYDDPAQLDEERGKVDELLEEIDEKLAAHDPATVEPETEVDTNPDPPAPVVEPGTDEVDRAPGSGKPLVIAGGVVLGLGVLGGVATIVGSVIATGANDISGIDRNDLVAREDQFAVGREGNITTVVGSITAGVLVPTGVALIVVGVLRNKKAKRQTSSSAALPMLSPSFGPAGAGLSLSGRF